MSEPAVGYARLSQEGKSIPERIEAIKEYCEQHDLELVEMYNDGEHASGFTDDRDQYQRLLAHLRDDRDVAHVVVRGLSRLSRDRLHRMQLLIELHREDVDVHAVDRGDRNPVDLSKPWALTREAGQADADDVEKRKEAERREREGLPNGPTPYGLRYSSDGERFVPDDGPAWKRAQDVLSKRKNGDSYREIAGEGERVGKDKARRIWNRREDFERAKKMLES